MFHKKDHQKSLYGVAMAIIIAGIILFSMGLVGWVMNFLSVDTCYLTVPSMKVMFGLVVMSLGYVFLELDQLRHK